MKNIQEIIHEVMKRRSLDGATRTTLEEAVGQVHRPSLFDYWVGVQVRPVVKSTPEAIVLGYEVLEHSMGWKGWRPAIRWDPAQLHLQAYDKHGNLVNSLIMLYSKHGSSRVSFTEYSRMPKIEGRVT